MTITLEARRGGPNQRGGDLNLRLPKRWFRVAAYFDLGPRMSHIGFWRTRWGTMRGLNLRFKWGAGYVTCLAHTNRQWDGIQQAKQEAER